MPDNAIGNQPENCAVRSCLHAISQQAWTAAGAVARFAMALNTVLAEQKFPGGRRS
jgi:hypothetical protein